MKHLQKIIKLYIGFFLFSTSLALHAQVGINTTSPQSTLDIRSSSQTLPINRDGILIPKIENFPITTPTLSQDGMLVYHKGNALQAKGFYYWDDTLDVWVFYGGVKKIHELKDGNSYFVNTTDGASVYLGANSIFDYGFTALTEEKNTTIGYGALYTDTLFDITPNPMNIANNTVVGYGSGSVKVNSIGFQKTFRTSFGYSDYANVISNLYFDEYSDFNHAIKQDGNISQSFVIGYAYGNLTHQILPHDGLSGFKRFVFIGDYFSTYNFVDISHPDSQYTYYYDWVGLGYETQQTLYNSNILKLQSYASDVFRGIFNIVNYDVFTSSTRPTIALGYRQLNGVTLYPFSFSRHARKQNISLGYLAHENSGVINNDSSNPTNWNNIALGANALFTSSDSNYNIAIGENALLLNTSHHNIAIGKDAMNQHGFGDDNTALGSDALSRNISSIDNVALGKSAGYNVSGDENTYIGAFASNGLATHFKDGSINIGAFSGYTDTNADRLYIENSSGTTPLIGGDFIYKSVGINRNINSLFNTFEVGGTASKSIAGNWLANSDGRLKKNILDISGVSALHKLSVLEGVSYFWNDTQTGNVRPENIQYGFIAQDLMQVFPEHVVKDKQGFYQTAYGTYDAFVVEAIKELENKFKNNDIDIESLDTRLIRIENLLLKSN